VTYRTSIRFCDENRRFLHRLQREAAGEVKRPVHVSELVDEVMTRFRKEVECREPRLQTPGDGGLPLPRDEDDDWLLVAAAILVREGF
jgi:hypothetical protein